MALGQVRRAAETDTISFLFFSVTALPPSPPSSPAPHPLLCQILAMREAPTISRKRNPGRSKSRSAGDAWEVQLRWGRRSAWRPLSQLLTVRTTKQRRPVEASPPLITTPWHLLHQLDMVNVSDMIALESLDGKRVASESKQPPASNFFPSSLSLSCSSAARRGCRRAQRLNRHARSTPPSRRQTPRPREAGRRASAEKGQGASGVNVGRVRACL